MSLLSSLRNWNTSVASKVMGAASSFGNSLSKAVSRANNRASASESMTFNLPEGVGLSGQNMSVAPNASTAFGKAYIDPNNQATIVNPNGKVNILSTGQQAGPNMSVDTNPVVMSAAPTIRSSTWTAPTDQYGRTSSSSAGTPYYLENGQLVTPTQGFSGLGGVSSQNFNISSNPITGNMGANGIGGGGSAFTGLLGGTGGQGTPSPSNQGDENARKKSSQLNQPGTAGQQTTNLPANLPPSFSVAPTAPAQQLNASPIDVNLDLAALTKLKAQTDKLLSNPYAMSANDSAALTEQLNSSFLAIKAKYDQSQPTPPNPVLDTQEQHDFMQQSEDPFGVKQAMDAFRASNTDLGNLQSQRIEVMKSIQALNDAYRPIIDDIKTNPNLPKALAARRLSDLQTKQKEVLQGFLDQQTILTQQISDQNETVNRAFNIATFSANQAEKAQDNMRQNLQLFVNTGAIGAFTPKEVAQYAKATGMAEGVIQSMVKSAKDPNIKSDMVGSAETGYKLVTYNTQTGAVVSTKSVVPGTGSSTGSKTTQKQQTAVNNFGGFIDEAISNGGDIQTALDWAVKNATDRGLKPDNDEYAALRDYATKKLASYKQQQQANLPQQNIAWPDINSALNGFLFGKQANNTANSTTSRL